MATCKTNGGGGRNTDEFMEGGEGKKGMNGKKRFAAFCTCHGFLLILLLSSSYS
jgi:hypothetical protein